jgi:Putative MetA-pathway of phenol degradation
MSVKWIDVYSLAFISLICFVFSASAQELDPRAYQPGPVGINAVTLVYTHSFGDILFEPSFPAKDVEASLHLGGAGYYRTFDFFGRFANISVAVPYAAGHLNGSVEDVQREIYRSGLGDMRTRFAVSLKGTPAMSLPEFAKHRKEANLGVSLSIVAPTGQYDSKKVINVGQNRWAFKPEVGLSKFINKWQMDIYGGAWFFSENDNFLGHSMTQKPLGSFQFHLTYNLRPGFWFGVNSNFYVGGRTTVNDIPGAIIQKNSRLGGTVTIPINRNQSMKFAVSRGVIATRGGDFTSLGASYNYAWSNK